MLKDQGLTFDGKEFELTNVFNDDIVEKDNYEERKETYGDKGFTEKKTMRKVCSIPQFLFTKEPLLLDYLCLQKISPVAAKKKLKLFLELHPQYKSNEGSL